MTPESTADMLKRLQELHDSYDEEPTLPSWNLERAALAEAIRRWPKEEELERLREAIKKHHAQKADDRCWLDDSELYAAAGLGPHDDRVGDKVAMLHNCERFIERRCEGGGWPSYAELEAKIAALEKELALWKPMAKEEAQAAYDAAEAVPMSEEQIQRIVDRVMDPAEAMNNEEFSQLHVRFDQCRRQRDAAVKALQEIADAGCPVRSGRFADKLQNTARTVLAQLKG